MKSIGPTEIWTRIAGFKVQSANHYTMGPYIGRGEENVKTLQFDPFKVMYFYTGQGVSHKLSKPLEPKRLAGFIRWRYMGRFLILTM